MNVIEAIFQREITTYGLLIAGFVVCGASLERWLLLRRAGSGYAEFMASVRLLLKKGDVEGVLLNALRDGNAAMRIVRMGLLQFSHGLDHVQRAILEAVESERARLSSHLSFLMATGVVATMLGLLTTIIEVAATLRSWSSLSSGSPEQTLGHALSLSLEPIAFGLAVGTLSLVLFFSLRTKIGVIIFQGRMAGSEVVDLLKNMSHNQAPLPVRAEGENGPSSAPARRTLVFEDDFYSREKPTE
jgi:biopolymer transport protein ExbB/TolQ